MDKPMKLPKRYEPQRGRAALAAALGGAGNLQVRPRSPTARSTASTRRRRRCRARIHIGHVFSYVQAEVVARFWRMRGMNVYYPFGFDDNGLPSERLVEKEKGVKATEVGREKFVEMCLELTKEYETEFKDVLAQPRDLGRLGRGLLDDRPGVTADLAALVPRPLREGPRLPQGSADALVSRVPHRHRAGGGRGRRARFGLLRRRVQARRAGPHHLDDTAGAPAGVRRRCSRTLTTTDTGTSSGGRRRCRCSATRFPSLPTTRPTPRRGPVSSCAARSATRPTSRGGRSTGSTRASCSTTRVT